MLGLVNRLILPDADGAGPETERGREVHEQVQSPLLDTLTRLGQTAAERYQQFDGDAGVSAGQRAVGEAV